MNLHKTFVKANCTITSCPHWNDPCCQLCTEVVKTDNSNQVDLMFVGMGAGKDEDINSNPRNINRQPWVGRAGKYLRNIITELWKEKSFNIALSNTVRCHPKNENGKDRAPSKVEETVCLPILYRDIINITPLVIVTCGKSATTALIGSKYQDYSMAKLRDIKDLKVTIRHECCIMNYRVVPTYHPSFLTRQYGNFKPEAKNRYDEYVIQDIRRALIIGQMWRKRLKKA